MTSSSSTLSSSFTTSHLVISFVAGAASGVIVYWRVVCQKQQRRKQRRPAPRRFAAAIQLKSGEEYYKRYRELHDDVWPAVLQRMYDSNIRNFTIYYHEETSTLFQCFEWVGHLTNSTTTLTKQQEEELFQQDMDAIANDPITRKWWRECEPCQEPFSQWNGKTPSEGGKGADWWAPLQCVCHAGYWPIQYSDVSQDPDFVKLENKGNDGAAENE